MSVPQMANQVATVHGMVLVLLNLESLFTEKIKSDIADEPAGSLVQKKRVHSAECCSANYGEQARNGLLLPAPWVRWSYADRVGFRDPLLWTPEMRPNFPLITVKCPELIVGRRSLSGTNIWGSAAWKVGSLDTLFRAHDPKARLRAPPPSINSWKTPRRLSSARIVELPVGVPGWGK